MKSQVSVEPVRSAKAENPWRRILYGRFPQQPYPLVVVRETIIPAASLWWGARCWITAFRAAGIRPGDRLVLALPSCPAFIQILIATLWEEYTLVLSSPDDDIEATLHSVAAVSGISLSGAGDTWVPDAHWGPEGQTGTRRVATQPTSDVRLLVRDSADHMPTRWVALSDANILAVVQRLVPLLEERCTRVLSALPWHHIHGILIDLLPALLAGAEIVKDPYDGDEPERLCAIGEQWQSSFLSVDLMLLASLLSSAKGKQLLRALRGGIVRGASVSLDMARFLAETQLRVGYGPPEASALVTLGEPGVWAPHYLGRPRGCYVRVEANGNLSFSGPNACVGIWERGALHRLHVDRWVTTDDRVRQRGAELFALPRS